MAHQALGWALQHDAIGRRFGKGWDRAGALAAYRKARELDPQDAITRADLAILLEHDEEGTRYAPGTQLEEAIAEYRALREELEITGFDQNRLVDLGRTGQFAEARAFAESLAPSAARNGWLLAAVAGERGAAAAIAESSRIASGADRTNALLGAGDVLVALRLYEAAAALLSEGAKGAKDPLQVRSRAEILARTKRHETVQLDDGDPRTVMFRLNRAMLASPFRAEAFTDLLSTALRKEIDGLDAAARDELVQQARAQIRVSLARGGVARDVALDVFPAVVQVHADGDDARGHRVRMVVPDGAGSQTFDLFVVKEKGGYRIAGMGNAIATLGPEILRRAAAGELDGARQFLDWVREGITPVGGDDPLAGHPFPRFWTKGEKGDADRIRTAAAVLLLTEEDDGRAVPILEAARERAPDDDRVRFDLALALAADIRRDHARAEVAARRLHRAHPRSDVALALLVRQLSLQDKWDACAEVIEARLAELPDDLTAARLRHAYLFQRGLYDESEKLLQDLVRRGRAEYLEYNSLAWVRLVRGVVDAETIEHARRSVRLVERSANRHTLAAVLADAGQVAEAREIVLDMMSARGADVPDSDEWYVFGRIAEQFGEREAALSFYRKVEQEKGSRPMETSYGLAQRRLK